MCGLAGVFGYLGLERTRLSIQRMLDVQEHRGPDSSGIWDGTVKEVNVGVGLRRLKILDLSDSANQPMISENGRFVVVFNGEIYNYVELRTELIATGRSFRTYGDTEVVLQSLIAWGSEAFQRFNGMWALLFLDMVDGTLLISRDRFGVKPLYIYSQKEFFFVSSEIKAILAAAERKFQVDASVANMYLRQSVLCATSATFFSDIYEFPAGHFAKISLADFEQKRLTPQRYWHTPAREADVQTEQKLIETVRETFIDSVMVRLRSDVPVGVLLSGGIDSSAIAAAVRHVKPYRDDIKLFSAVGKGGDPDEQPFIDLMARHLNRSPEKVVLDFPPSRALDLINEVSWYNDEPIVGFPTVAHYLVMKRAKELGITVLLSGQGADETLCGYKKYFMFYLQELIRSGKWFAAGQLLQASLRKGTVLSQLNYQDARRYLPGWLRFPETDVRGPALLASNDTIQIGLNGSGIVARQALDVESLSVPALVHYEDRMSMAASREIRLPFLDYRFVSLVVPLPVQFKLRDGWTKWIFRRAMEGLLPKEIAWRKDKQHFNLPQNNWLRRELQENIMQLINSEWKTEQLGLLDRKKFAQLYAAYLRQPSFRRRPVTKDILAPIALELWARRFEPYLSV